MTDIICPLCGKPNPPDLDECQYCQAPLKTAGFVAPPEGGEDADKLFPLAGKDAQPQDQAKEGGTTANLEQAIPDWLKKTEANFLDQSEETNIEEPAEPGEDKLSQRIDSLFKEPAASEIKKENAIDDDWLSSLLAEAGVDETAQPSTPGRVAGETAEQGIQEVEAPPQQEAAGEPAGEPEQEMPPAIPAEEKPDWLASLEAASTLKWEAAVTPPEQEQKPAEEKLPEPEPEPEKPPELPAQPDWLKPASVEEPPTSPTESEPEIAPAELPSWLEALKPAETVAPSPPVEDVSSADIVTAGPLAGLRGVISPHPSAVRPRKPPTYSIKLRVTDDQRARVEMMEELLADEEKPSPLPSPPILTTRNIFRIIIAVALLLPVIWMIISGGKSASPPQPGSLPGVVDFTQQLQSLPSGVPVLIAFDYEAGFSGELNVAIANAITQLMNKNAFLVLVSTTPSGPALAESTVESVHPLGNTKTYSSYANLGYVPGGTLGLSGLVSDPPNILPYSLNNDNVWTAPPLDGVTNIKDFSAVIVFTNDADTARIWIEQAGPSLRQANRPLLFVSSAQAEPLILPYYQSTPAQVQGLIAGLSGGVAYARTLGNVPQNGEWDAYSVGITVSILILLVGTIAGGVIKMASGGDNTDK